MISSKALLAGLAGAFVFAAPALAQEATETTPPATEQAAAPASLTLTPGSTVKSKDGTEIGKLVGVQAGANGQELTVRGADGQVRAVSLAGIEASGSDVMIDATLADFQAATPIASENPPPITEPEPVADPTATPDQPTEPTAPVEPQDTPVEDPDA